jgi:probable F420-dependent oxidoreductase
VFQVFAATPEDMGPGEIGIHAARAEAMGFDGLQVPDAIHDGLVLAAMALHATSKLIVGTAVLVAFPRSPMTVAIASWDLQKMSGGRFELGLGTQVKQNIEQRYSARWDSPVPQLREYLQSLRAIFDSFQTGAKLNFEGEHYRFTRLQPFFNPGPIDHPDIPILCGAVGPAMTRMVGRVADGMITHPTNTPPEYIRQVCLPRLQAGFELAGRDGADFKLILAPLTATGKDRQTVAAQWEKQR